MFGVTKNNAVKKFDMQISKDTAYLLKSNASEAGFTVLEILVSLAIVAILTSIAIPRLQSIFAQHEVEATASEMVQQIEAARVFAQANNVTVMACPVAASQLNLPESDIINSVGGNCAPIIVSSSGNGSVTSAPQVNWQAWVWIVNQGGSRTLWQRGFRVPDGVVVNPARSSITFDGGGRPGNTFQTITIQSNSVGFRKSIVISSFTGRVTLGP